MMKPHYHDIHVPLSSSASSSSSSSLSSKRKHQQACIYQTRLHQLGYHGIAFCHTAYGRLNVDRDDADVALPWKDLVLQSSSTDEKVSSLSFGRTNSLGMKIYRRLNIIVEEVSDVSSILLHTTAVGATPTKNVESSSTSSISKLLQKYDIVSLQPMNEPALQNICELLSPSALDASAGNASLSSSNIVNNTNFIDLLVLEYATGSRGGYGLPYRLRKEYLVKALRAGVTFELCYGTAILDPKRRQGFLRTLVDFQSNYNGIQKKHMLLNNTHHPNKKCSAKGRRNETKFPLLLSSGSRQNYTRGTGDEGVMALRMPQDVKSLVCHLVGGGDGGGWFEKGGEFDVVDGMYDEEDDGIGGGGKNHKKKKGRKQVVVVSAAERVLARASERALGVVDVSTQQNKRKRDWNGRSCVIGYSTRPSSDDATKEQNHVDDDNEDEEEDDSFCIDGGSSLIDWLSEPLNKKTNVRGGEADIAANETANDVDLMKNDEGGRIEPIAGAAASSTRKNSEDSSENEEEDLEDGFIAL